MKFGVKNLLFLRGFWRQIRDSAETQNCNFYCRYIFRHIFPQKAPIVIKIPDLRCEDICASIHTPHDSIYKLRKQINGLKWQEADEKFVKQKIEQFLNIAIKRYHINFVLVHAYGLKGKFVNDSPLKSENDTSSWKGDSSIFVQKSRVYFSFFFFILRNEVHTFLSILPLPVISNYPKRLHYSIEMFRAQHKREI